MSMAALLSRSMGELKEPKSLFPLFQKSSGLQNGEPKSEVVSSLPIAQCTNEKVAPKRGRPSKQAKLATVVKADIVVEGSYTDSMEVDPNLSRRKRCRTDSPGSKDCKEEHDDEASSPIIVRRGSQRPSRNNKHPLSPCDSDASVQVPTNILAETEALNEITPSFSAESQHELDTDGAEEVPKPKKILHFNPKTGTIGSPPSKKPGPQENNEKENIPATKRSIGRPRSSRSKLVIIQYSSCKDNRSDVGSKIGEILNSTRPVSIPEVSERAKKPCEGTPWWLMGKIKTISKAEAADTAAGPAREHLISNSSDIEHPRLRREAKVFAKPAKTAFSDFGSNARMLRFPGAVEPAWPRQGMIHVRGDSSQRDFMPPLDGLSRRSKSRKSKYQAVEIGRDEDIISELATKLKISEVMDGIQEINLDDFAESPACLRKPIKRFESGRVLQKRVRKELSAALTSIDMDELSGDSNSTVHPALSKVFHVIATKLSAFDRFECETQSWCQKYSPIFSSDVLQNGKEVAILREWLQTLKVKSVETGSDRAGSSKTAKSEIPSKRKRRSKKLDGFVVSSDEENNDMDEIADPEDKSCFGRPGKRSVINSKDAIAKGSRDPGRLTNAVVVSGPSGCGKTAAIYAVARELDFEVFEINPGSRRSGKDVLEKVGDMTRNHLVHGPNDVVEDDDSKRLSKAFDDDLKSGRQGTMNAFFKPKKSKEPAKAKVVAKTSEDKISRKTSPKQQKQSLILLEEVDILYEEDKQFWATIITLITRSKRPVIMTCNDESAVPLLSLSLHAIIRFNPPPTELAVDYMVLIAASEGHIIKREAVQALYEGRRFDLRASLTELNFWCQIGVGDVKGGLEWIEPRWPLRCDLDQNGDTKRIISKATYEPGMGWLSKDIVSSDMHHLDIEEEVMHEAWDSCGLDIDLQSTINIGKWANTVHSMPNPRDALAVYDEFTGSISAADLCSVSAVASENYIPHNTSLPPLTAKVRSDYPIAYPILETHLQPTSTSQNPQLSTLRLANFIKIRAREDAQIHSSISCSLPVSTYLDGPKESNVISLIRSPPPSLEQQTLSRSDFSLGFDPISYPPWTWPAEGSIEPSVFDRKIEMLATDVAPYVRAIVRFEERLRMERVRLGGGLMIEGGKSNGTKRMRTTRSAYSALEGGERSKTRRENYFGEGVVNAKAVERTAGEGWAQIVNEEVEDRRAPTAERIVEDRGEES